MSFQMVGYPSGVPPVPVCGLPRRDCSFYPCFQSPCHTNSTFPAEIVEGDVLADVVDRYNYPLTNLTWGLIPVSTQQKVHWMRFSHHLLAQTPRLGSYVFVAQNLLLRYIEPSKHSLPESFLKFFTKWKDIPERKAHWPLALRMSTKTLTKKTSFCSLTFEVFKKTPFFE